MLLLMFFCCFAIVVVAIVVIVDVIGVVHFTFQALGPVPIQN
jgi:hypothetical protein